MQFLKHTADLRDAVSRARQSGLTIGLVPTMGALHPGHGALIDRARAESGCVIVSIFVNPLQFDRKDDYERYARTLSADLEFCRQHGADFVFAPDANEIYPGPTTRFRRCAFSCRAPLWRTSSRPFPRCRHRRD